MSGTGSISDLDARRAAETTFDRNVVVVAGAGTGKTTLLVNRVIHLLMKEPHPVSISETVALTYTNKAATEMKIRLRERLAGLARDSTASVHGSDGGAVTVADLRARYGLSATDIAVRATAALRDLEKAQIGTVHSFAAHLLRLFPLESGADPAFREDDGLRFDEHFAMAWDVWVDRELGREGTQHRRWRALLESTTLEQLRALTYALCSELVDLDALVRGVGSEPDASLVDWIQKLRERAQVLLNAHDRTKRRKIEHMLAAAIALMTLVLEHGADAMDRLDPTERQWLEKEPGQSISEWDPVEFQQAVSIVKILQQFLTFDQAYFINVLTLLQPFVSTVRTSFADTGWISFDGLLACTRRLLWEHPEVRERIKRNFRAILIDEFQDTDPVQYEILLALAEQQGRFSRAWQDMTLEPGKLFIVGDPKQSIYAFRRADIEAFDRVVDKVLAEGGVTYSLITNFRSNARILGPVNDVFDRLFVRQPLVQPANVHLEPDGRLKGTVAETGLVLHVVASRPGDDPFDAAGAARAEGEVLARWLREDLLTRPGVSAGQVAFLFRKLTQADAYLDALRRYDVPYLIEGEKHFYRRQEVIDLVNVLRVLDHPHDHIALLGVLRSPLGGLTDRDIYDLHEAGLFDYRDDARIMAWSNRRAGNVQRLYRHLHDLHRLVPAAPLDEAIQLVFDRLPVLELAAASLHGEQAVANLLKVKQTAAALADRPHLTLSGFTELMVARLDEQPDEAESPLAEDSSDAVQILTIHKAKGLEFPVVVLPGLHQGSGRDRVAPSVVYDWSTNSYGLSTGPHRTLGYLRVQEKQVERERAERRRVFYVGMTRAKDLLLLSGGLISRSVGESVLEWLGKIGEGDIGDPLTPTVRIGSSEIAHRVVQAPDRKWPRRISTSFETGPAIHAPSIARLWEERTARWDTTRASLWHLTPSSMRKSDSIGDDKVDRGSLGREIGRLVGVIAHRILERWNFTSPPDALLGQIASSLDPVVPAGNESVRAKVEASLEEIFTSFGASESYARLRSAEILGREVPFLMPWNGNQAMEGVIDVIYRLDGKMWIADYKTDRVTGSEAPAQAGLYVDQAAIYREAAARCLGLSQVSFQLLFLRAGVSIDL
ncbi:MAG TPA: UvrD-helicase domain-containing protein [Nitrospira sp.]|nr:UvrD-helicase domain-containing protein [Nitrospira sp.]